ncbi:ATP-binding cassette domain-containing protein, partial [Bacillus sp. B-TM1]
MTLAIEMKDVMKSFNEKTALRNVNIEVKQGEIFGFLGPSGSGKTTTVKIFTFRSAVFSLKLFITSFISIANV